MCLSAEDCSRLAVVHVFSGVVNMWPDGAATTAGGDGEGTRGVWTGEAPMEGEREGPCSVDWRGSDGGGKGGPVECGLERLRWRVKGRAVMC